LADYGIRSILINKINNFFFDENQRWFSFFCIIYSIGENQMWCVYRIYYKSKIVYVGRTNNIEKRISQHMLNGKLINILKVSKVEFAELETESDMNLYELYYILKLKPDLNTKDFAKDELTIELPDLPFREFFSGKWDTWINKAKIK